MSIPKPAGHWDIDPDDPFRDPPWWLPWVLGLVSLAIVIWAVTL